MVTMDSNATVRQRARQAGGEHDQARHDFGRVADGLHATGLSESHQAALWLWAWSLRDSAVQRRDARLTARWPAKPEAHCPNLGGDRNLARRGALPH
jgi:hypothetical protein